MRGAWRFTIACLAAGLMLGPATASAQDAATTTNTPAAQTVGPRELQNFSLQGNVTRRADQPPQRPSTPSVATAQDGQSAAPAPATRQYSRERSASAEPPVTAPRTSPRREEVRETAAAD